MIRSTAGQPSVFAHNSLTSEGSSVPRFSCSRKSRGVDFQEPVLGAQLGQRERGFGARGQHQMKLARGMPQQERQGIMYFRMNYPVIIIQEQIDFIFAVGQLVDQSGNDRIYRHQEEKFGDLADGRFADAVAGAPQRMG